jgi:uncharacterized membrane protein
MTRSVFGFLKTTVIGGFLVILPAVAALLLIAKALETVRAIAEPVATWLAVRALLALVIEVAILVGLCFLMGLVIRAEIGLRAWGWVERSWLERLPMYAFFKNLGQSLAGKEEGRLASALAETGDGLVPAFIVEEHADGRLTVFVPTVPTPAMGALFIMEPSRVHRIDVPLSRVAKCVAEWGRGSKALVAALPARAGRESIGPKPQD